MSEKNNPVISFEGYRINSLHYDTVSKSEYENQKNLEIQIKYGINMEGLKGIVKFTVVFKNSGEDYRTGTLEIDGQFSIRKDLNEEKAKMYISENGSAMVYPYVRTVLSIITSLDAPQASVLPSLNFTDAKKDMK